jgi:phenylpyruvate tautomerase PptA (4-oxalocrotonate tautomerase family)
MPMCDIYIPEGALRTEAESALVKRVSDILVRHEMRRMADATADPAEVEASRERASSIAWMFIHRTETYVAGESAEAPYYKFEVTIPEGLIDDVFRDSIVSDLTRAVADAEGGKWRHVSQRVWVFTYQVPDGSWGSAGRTMRLRDIVDFVAPGNGEFAEQRFAEVRRAAATAAFALAERHPATA